MLEKGRDMRESTGRGIWCVCCVDGYRWRVIRKDVDLFKMKPVRYTDLFAKDERELVQKKKKSLFEKTKVCSRRRRAIQ